MAGELPVPAGAGAPPGAPGAPGAPPPQAGGMAAPPTGGIGGATAMRPMMGTGAHGLVLVRTGVEALQKSLLGLPMGSELHTAVLKAITEISRRMDSGSTNHSEQIQALGAMARDAQNPQASQLAKMFGGGGGQAPPELPPPPGGGAPPGAPG